MLSRQVRNNRIYVRRQRLENYFKQVALKGKLLKQSSIVFMLTEASHYEDAFFHKCLVELLYNVPAKYLGYYRQTILQGDLNKGLKITRRNLHYKGRA